MVDIGGEVTFGNPSAGDTEKPQEEETPDKGPGEDTGQAGNGELFGPGEIEEIEKPESHGHHGGKGKGTGKGPKEPIKPIRWLKTLFDEISNEKP